jgi:FkbH-like protein
MSIADSTAPAGTTAMERLRELHRNGELVAEYPVVQRILPDVPDAELSRAGRLLGNLSTEAVLAAHPSTPSVSVVVTGHGTLSPLIPALTAELARHGILLRSTVSDFDSYVFDLSDQASALYIGNPDLVLCVLDPRVVIDELPTPWRVSDVERVLAEKMSLFGHLASTFIANSRATLVLNTIPLPRTLTSGLVDHRSRAEVGALWRDANATLLRLSTELPSLVVLDLDPVLTEGVTATDPRLSVYAKAHLSAELLAHYARDVGHLAKNMVGRARKCLVVDLDGTLWGGVLGDDGIDGIEVADSYRGEAFRDFQRMVKQLSSQGVLLAAVSKNDVADVRSALRDHPRMTVLEDDFVRISANWRPKSENLAELAADLNLGVDSFVFVDDSAYECGLVRHELPSVAVVRLDAEPALHPTKLSSDGWFDVPELTAEDAARPARYRDELARRDFLADSSSIQDYLDQLGITVRLGVVRANEVPRISQITSRTNQFNLTTRRLGPSDVAALLDDPAHLVLGIHSGDRFGDNGLVGAMFLRRAGDTVHLDNMLLSCRVFSRGIEQACLSAVLRHARDTAAREVLGYYRPSAKNGKVADLFPRMGFAPATTDADTAVFRHDLAVIMPSPGHVTMTEEFEGDTP